MSALLQGFIKTKTLFKNSIISLSFKNHRIIFANLYFFKEMHEESQS